MPPWTRGWRVFTRPPRISGAWVKSPTPTTFTPASASAFCVPPVERSSTPRAARRFANGTRPVLSETETRARRTMAGNLRKGCPSSPLRAVFQAGRRARPPAGLPVAGRVEARLVLGDGAEPQEPARLHLADPLAGEVHDRPHLLERDAAAVGDVERAGLAELPDLLVREVQLDGPGRRVHVEVEVVLARDEHARPRAVRAVGARAGPLGLDLPHGGVELGIDEPERPLAPQLARDLLARHRLRPAPSPLPVRVDLVGRLRLHDGPHALLRLAHPLPSLSTSGAHRA